jgi:hypothetical protein
VVLGDNEQGDCGLHGDEENGLVTLDQEPGEDGEAGGAKEASET